MPVLTAKDLDIGYKRGNQIEKVVSIGLNLELCPGELICLVGPNGSGKSTLLRTITGLQKALAGEVLLHGKPIESYDNKALAKVISVVLTTPVRVGAMRAYDLVGLGRFPFTDMFDQMREEDHKVVRTALEMAGATPLAERFVHTLSDGERQKVMIARALAQEPSLLMLDEPTAFLDLPGRVSVMQLLRDLAHGHDKAILTSTHDLDLAMRIADRVWLMGRNGEFLQGAPEDLALDGSFSSVFSIGKVQFDAYTGQFQMNGMPTRQVMLKADGLNRIWAEKALNRAGFSVAVEAEIQLEFVENAWCLSYQQKQESFENIYDLLQTLRNIEFDKR